MSNNTQVQAVPDTVDFIIAYESGELDQDEIIAGFQRLKDDGILNHLQGSYQRMAVQLFESGLIQ